MSKNKNLTERKIAELRELLKHRAEARELLKGKKVKFKWADEDKTIREYLLSFDEDGDELTGLIKFIFTRGDSLRVVRVKDGSPDVQIFDSETTVNPASWLQKAISKASEVLKESDLDKTILNLIRQCFLRDNASPWLPKVPDGFQLRLVDNKSAEHVFFFEQGKFSHISTRDGITPSKTVVDKKLMEELKEQINKNNFELDVPVTNLGNVHLIKYKFIDGILCSSLVSKHDVSNLPTTLPTTSTRGRELQTGNGSGLVIESSATEFLPTSEYYAKMLEKALTTSLSDEARSGASADSAREHSEIPPDMTKTPKQIPKNLEEKLKTLAVATEKSGEAISITSKDFISDSGDRIAKIGSDVGAEAIEYVEDAGSKLKIKARPILTQKIIGKAAMNLELAGVELDGKRCEYFDSNTDLFVANFRGCVFSNVDFSAVKNLDTVLFTNCKFGDGCIFPKNFVFKQSNLKEKITMESLQPYVDREEVSISRSAAAVIKNPSGVALSMERIRKGSAATSAGA